MLPLTMRSMRQLAIFASLMAACGIIYLISQTCKEKNTSYATPYDENTVPFTDLSGSASLKAAKFWKSHKPSYPCPSSLLTRVGKEKGDGGKWMCGLETFSRYTVNEGYNCTFYSFGVKEDSAFEADVLQKTLCSVHAYDPTVNEIGPPLKPSNPRVHFHKMGISGNSSDSQKLPTRTLKTLMEENGHDFIDILKIDVEGYEYASIERMLGDFDNLPFGQLLMEIHNSVWKPEKVNKVFELVRSLEKRGARVFSVEPNARALNCCSEFSFINLHYRRLWIPDGQ